MAINRILPVVTCVLALAGCAYPGPETLLAEPPRPAPSTPAQDELMALPPPTRQLAVAVYSFTDQTGQNRPNDDFPEYSRAVTQGGAAILVNALKKAGNNSWFRVVERTALPALLQERQIIRQTREAYGGQDLTPIPPLTYAGLLLDGGIIGYDSNTLSGGFGARFLGIGGDTQYRRDTVTVYVRAIAVQNGEVLKSVSTTKTIYSVALNGGTFRYVDFKELLEIETGVATNEPVMLAVRQAIEKSVHSLIVEGLLSEDWSFQDERLEPAIIQDYLLERDGTYNVQRIPVPNAAQPAVHPAGTGPRPGLPQTQAAAAPNRIDAPRPQGIEPVPGSRPGSRDERTMTPGARPGPAYGPTYGAPGRSGFSPVLNGEVPGALMSSLTGPTAGIRIVTNAETSSDGPALGPGLRSAGQSRTAQEPKEQETKMKAIGNRSIQVI